MAAIKINKANNFLEDCRALQKSRQEVFSNRTDKWQASLKGEQYEFRTQELEGILDDLENALDALNTWVNED